MAEEHKDVRQVDDTGVTTVIAKLANHRGFARGDFTIIQGEASGTLITNIKLSDANTNDKGKSHQNGEFFYISNFPTRGSLASNDNYLNRPSVKSKMEATLVLTEKDSIQDTKSQPPGALKGMIKTAVRQMLAGNKKLGSTCQLAPINLKDAVKRSIKVDGGPSGTQYKALPPNGEVKTDRKGKKIFTGLYTNYDRQGNMSIAANNRGLIVDKDGNIETTGTVDMMENPAEPHGLIGMPTKKNGLRDINPGTFAYPMGLGPLALSRIPDFSIINWGLKIMAISEVVSEIKDLIDEKQKRNERISVIVEERQQAYEKERNNSVKGKIT